MANETEETEIETTETPAEKPDHVKQAFKDRDAAKKRAREAEAKLRELEEREAARETEKAEREAEQERKKNDFAALEKRLQKERDDARKEAAEAKALIDARLRSDRVAALVDAVMPKLGATPRTVVKGVLKELSETVGLDIAPESIDDKTAADVAKQVREAMGELFPSRSGGSPGAPGVNLSTKKPGEKPDEDPRVERVKQLARKHSQK